jgi:hypothetical protein
MYWRYQKSEELLSYGFVVVSTELPFKIILKQTTRPFSDSLYATYFRTGHGSLYYELFCIISLWSIYWYPVIDTQRLCKAKFKQGSLYDYNFLSADQWNVNLWFDD